MAHLPFAFSVSHFINSVGADAGFASIIGLAILVLLYFAQARETSTLRERADDAEHRAGALEARLAQVSRAQSAQPGVAQRPAAARPLVNPAPGTVTAARGAGTAPAQAGVTTTAPAMATAALPSAPVGVGAPALASATRLIPLPQAAPSPVATPQPAPAEASPESTQPPAAAPRPATVAAQAAAAPPATASPAPVAAGATAVFAGGNGPGTPDSGTNGASDHGEDEYYSDEFSAVATQAPEPEPLPRVQLRPGGSGPVRPSQGPTRRASSPRGPARLGRVFLVLLGVLAVAGIAVVLVAVTSNGGGQSASSGSAATTNTPTARHRAKGKALVPSSLSIGVLNGTAQAGLAAKVMSQLSAAGYKQGITPANAANQTQTTTVVAYLPGQRAAAAQVAKSLKLSSSTVQPIDSQTQQLACPQASSCAVNVVVVVGQDLAGG